MLHNEEGTGGVIHKCCRRTPIAQATLGTASGGSCAMGPASTTAMMRSVVICHILPSYFAFHARIPIVHAPAKVTVAPPSSSMLTESCAPTPPAGEVASGRLAWLENFELDSRGKVGLLLLDQRLLTSWWLGRCKSALHMKMIVHTQTVASITARAGNLI